jgi:hypothetical protein
MRADFSQALALDASSPTVASHFVGMVESSSVVMGASLSRAVAGSLCLAMAVSS